MISEGLGDIAPSRGVPCDQPRPSRGAHPTTPRPFLHPVMSLRPTGVTSEPSALRSLPSAGGYLHSKLSAELASPVPL